LILSSHLCLALPSGLFCSGIPTKTLYVPLVRTICVEECCHICVILMSWVWIFIPHSSCTHSQCISYA
jgi:hypothetical protein